ncbi:hypothetical protein L1987_78260 [Smallanthus sonchifolius]|uniref:Uncharacterized protein n=1 Tax=Smallanthus sonchifolius TaxID=185202 RepID=A0ACB8ZD90_9ASTR|nr:hypothetical protein L1987_78260 [Smallanthus sonchifolius]
MKSGLVNVAAARNRLDPVSALLPTVGGTKYHRLVGALPPQSPTTTFGTGALLPSNGVGPPGIIIRPRPYLPPPLKMVFEFPKG